MRVYRAEDIPAIVALLEEAWPELPNYAAMQFDAERTAEVLRKNTTNSTFLCLVWEEDDGGHNVIVGGITAMVSPVFFSFDVLAEDIFLYVTPKHRTLARVDALIEAYKEWARLHKATIISASQTSGVKEDKMAILLARRGFERIGSLYRLKQV